MAIEVTDEIGFSKTAIIVWGVLSVVVGFFLITHPAKTALFMVEVMALFWVIGGIMDVIRSIVQRSDMWGVRLMLAILSIIAGLYILSNLILGAIFIVQVAFIFLAISAIMNGIFNIIAGFRIEGGVLWAGVIVGTIQFLIGFWLLGFRSDAADAVVPELGAVVLVPVLGAFMLAGGVMSIITSFWVNSPAAGVPAPAPAAEGPSEPAA